MTDVQPSVPATPEPARVRVDVVTVAAVVVAAVVVAVDLSSAEVDTRLFGMVIAVVVIWIAFNILSGGDFLTARNMWNLSVQSTSIAIMATGMVLIIVSRNIDLSVGSLLGFLGYVDGARADRRRHRLLQHQHRSRKRRRQLVDLGDRTRRRHRHGCRGRRASRGSSSPTAVSPRSSSRSAAFSSGEA